MDFIELKKHCLEKHGAYEDFPFGPETTVIKAGNKMFALLSVKSGKVYISLKCDPFVAQSLREQYPSVSPGYHLNKEHWNTVIVDGSIPESEISWMIEHSYQLVVQKLPKDARKDLTPRPA